VGETGNRIVAKTAADVANPAVTALMAAAAVVLGHPELAIAAVPGGALAGALTEEGVAVVQRAWQSKSERVNRFAASASAAAHQPIEDLMAEASEDDRARDLMARTVDSAADTSDTWKIDTLAKAFVRGAKDPAEIDEMLILVDYLRELEVPHARTLAVLHLRQIEEQQLAEDARQVDELVQRPELESDYKIGSRPLAQDPAGDLKRLLQEAAYRAAVRRAHRGGPGTMPALTPARLQQILQDEVNKFLPSLPPEGFRHYDPALGTVVIALLMQLERKGLCAPGERGGGKANRWSLTPIGEYVAQALARLGAEPQRRYA
jgi:hypothetical protein